MNKEQKTEIKKPSIFGLREWREEYGYTTPEWEAYAKSSTDLNVFCIAIGFAIGILGVALGRY